MGSIYRPQGRTHWVIKYKVGGQWEIESTHTDDRDEAARLLRDRESARDKGVPVSPAMGRVRWEDAVEDLKTDYANKDQHLKALGKLQHLTKVFAGRRMASITAAEIAHYTKQRRADTYLVQRDPEMRRPYSNNQIRHELTLLRRMFNLQIELGRLSFCPHIALPDEGPARKGFFSREDLEALCRHLPAPIDDMARVMFITGWRVDSEVLPLEWRHVDFAANELRLDAEMTKTDEGRVFVMTDELRALLLRLQVEHQARVKAGQMVPWVFVRMLADARGGVKTPRPVRSIRKAWRNACRAAGLPGRIPHDFRRTAARNMVRAGIPERVAMKLTGHKTRSVFDRYNIVSDTDLSEAAAKLNDQRAPVSHRRTSKR